MIIVESKRKKTENIQKKYPDAIIADVTSNSEFPELRKLSPFYPHGGIPVPFSNGIVASCVEAIWQGLKVFESADVDVEMFKNATMKNIKRTVRKFGKPLGHRKGVNGIDLLGYIDARKQIYIPSYKWMLEHHCMNIIERLRESSKTRTVVLLDYDTNADVEDASKPLSHASLVKAYAEGIYPYGEQKDVERVENPAVEKNNNDSNLIFYTNDNGNVSVQVQYEGGTFWLNQKRMAELFGVDVRTINEHIGNIYQTKEASMESTIRKIRIVQREGSRDVERELNFYHLDVVIAVGYRVNSKEATQFRIWATKTLNDFITKGYVLDKERLKSGPQFGHDYFKNLLEDIREIRASERRFYQKITDIYALAIDYDKDAEVTKNFFASVQNKLHWAISGQTAAEIIYNSADAEKIHMGLTTWRHAPNGKILKSDVTIAKNYLDEKHISALNRLVSAYLDLAEDRAEQEIPTTMSQWSELLNGFLTVAGRPVLDGQGSISALEAKIKAEAEYDIFRKKQDLDYVSDFDKEIKRLKGK